MSTLAQRLDGIAATFPVSHPSWKTTSEASISITLAIQQIQKLLDTAPPDTTGWIGDAKKQMQHLIAVLEL